MFDINEKIHSDVTGRTYTITWASDTVANAEVGFASTEAEGNVYFIKKLLTPHYPTDDAPLSAALKAQRRELCENRYRKFSAVYNAVRNGCGEGGACVPILDYFREGAFYYTVYRKINASSLTLDEISELPQKEKYRILLRLVQGLLPLHTLGVIHGDLKPDNILVQRDGDSWKIRLIDMNDCYIAGEPMEPGSVLGTLDYYSPELATYNFYEIEDWEDDEEMAMVRRMANALTVKSDVFALGIIFCEFFSGCRPLIKDDRSGAIFEAANEGTLELPNKVLEDNKIATLIHKMLTADFRERPTLAQVGADLQKIINNKLLPPEIEFEPEDNDEYFNVILSTYSDGYILYTIDDTNPCSTSTRYEKPFKVKKFTTIKAITTDGKRKTVVETKKAWVKREHTHSPKIIVKGRDICIIPNDKSPLETKIYYTTNGEEPSAKSFVYSEKFVAEPGISKIRAIAIGPLAIPSKVVEANVYMPKVAKPIIHYRLGRISIVSKGGHKIFYTLDGSNPTVSSMEYKEEFTLPDTTRFHVKAVCVDDVGTLSDVEEIQRPNPKVLVK